MNIDIYLFSYYNDYVFANLFNMMKILQSTSRGQITLPKSWRSKFDTNYYEAKIKADQIIIMPLTKKTTFKETLDVSWHEYQKGESMSHEDMMKKYGL